MVMPSVSARELTLLSCGMAMFSVALMAPMPWTLVLLPLVAAPVLTMRGARGGATVAPNPDAAPDTGATGGARSFAIASVFRADAPTPAEVRRADAADLVRMDDDGGRQQWATP